MSFIYDLALQNYSFPGILADDIKAVLVRTGGGEYVPNPATDDFLDIIPVPSQVAVSPNLAGKTWTLGMFGCSDFSFGVVAAGAPCQGFVIFHDTGVPATSRLICLIDTGLGLPVTPDGVSTVSVGINPAGLFALEG